MSEDPDQIHVAKQWIAKADNDLRNAEHTIQLEVDCPFDTVCFHAQQCAEKCLKALLVFHGIDPPRVHDVRMLVRQLPPQAAGRFDIEGLLVLNRYSVEARYPGEWDPILREDAEEALRLARLVRETTRELLSSGP